MTGKKLLLLGHTGKMGTAISQVFAEHYEVIGKNSTDFDALDRQQLEQLLEATKPDILINTIAFLGIDLCEEDQERALKLNTMLPRDLANLSERLGFILIHFSTDAVFPDTKPGTLPGYVESDKPNPVNIYGLTKSDGDSFVQSHASRYYIFRVPILFGAATKEHQFVEKMLKAVREGKKELRVVDDVISSPSYSVDIAEQIMQVLESELPFGLYHLSNAGQGSLFDLMEGIVVRLSLPVTISKTSFTEFPSNGKKNTHTPLRSEKIAPLRPWQEALTAYCNTLNLDSAVRSMHLTQPIASPGKTEEDLITNKVTAISPVSPDKSIDCAMHALPTAESRLKNQEK